MKLKSILFFTALVCASLVSSAQNVARYVDEQGNILKEYPLYNGENNLFNLRQTMQNVGDDRHGMFNVIIPEPGVIGTVKGIEFIQSGTRNFDLTLSSSEVLGLTIEYADNGNEGSRVASRSSHTSTIQGGRLMRIIVNLPNGFVPTANLELKFPGNTETRQYATYLGFYGATDQWPIASYALPEERTQWMAEMAQTEEETTYYWHRDPIDYSKWSFVFVMPDCDTTFDITCDKVADLVTELPRKAMQQLYRKYTSYPMTFMNGDSYLTTWLGDGIGQDNYSAIINQQNVMWNWDFTTKANYWYDALPWEYSMHLIDAANLVPWLYTQWRQSQDDVVNAQMKVLRAHGYLRLLQYYAPRWSDSNNGAALCAPIYNSLGTLEKTMASMKEIIEFCYADLKEAISVLPDYSSEDCGMPTKDVARGVLVRLAMLSEDWQTAATYAQQIVDSYSNTTNADLFSGFYQPANSWIWSVSDRDKFGNTRLHYYSAGSQNAINGPYTIYWEQGSWQGAIDRVFYKKCFDTEPYDERLKQFAMPESMTHYGVKPEWFTDQEYFNGWTHYFFSIVWDTDNALKTAALKWANDLKPEGLSFDIQPRYTFLYGQQAKFWTPETLMGNQFSTPTSICLMRTEEFILDLAEAKWHLGKMAEANALIRDLYLVRTNGYTTIPNKSGYELLELIQMNRRLELWGEGHSWFDAKRWGASISRKAWWDNNASGNWPDHCAFSVAPQDYNGWRFVIPGRALKANPSIDINALSYDIAEGYPEASNSTQRVRARRLTSPCVPLQSDYIIPQIRAVPSIISNPE